MQTDIKQRWLEALRSGDYEQGQFQLKRQDASGVCRFCCLGVLADICEIPNVIEADGVYEYRFSVNDLRTGCLGSDFRTQIGMSSEMHSKLASLNDSERMSFSEIADWIDANL